MPMATKYTKNDAKDYAREHMRGIWAAALNPFNDDLSINEAGLRSNIRHWIDDLDIKGLFIAGKQGEFFSMSLDERKRNFEIAVDECDGKAGVIVSVSDQNFDTVKELAHHAEAVGEAALVPMRDHLQRHDREQQQRPRLERARIETAAQGARRQEPPAEDP